MVLAGKRVTTDGHPVAATRTATAAAHPGRTRMITQSSNLATNLRLSRVGLATVNEDRRLAGATSSFTNHLIEDYAAKNIGIVNVVTAADLARLFLYLGPFRRSAVIQFGAEYPLQLQQGKFLYRLGGMAGAVKGAGGVNCHGHRQVPVAQVRSGVQYADVSAYPANPY
jgi:hypothetical protein